MSRLLVGLPGESSELEVEVTDAEGIILGRAPRPDALAPTSEGRPPLRGVAVTSASVSTNHLIAWSNGNELTVYDVGSRHGSWLRLPASQPVRIVASEPVRLRLSDAYPSAQRLAGPTETDCEAADHAGAVVRAIEVWLSRLGASVSLKYYARQRSDHGTDHPGRFPLASGGELSVVPDETMDARWDGILRELWRYIERENSRFDAEKASRADGLILASSAIRKAHRHVIEAAQRGARLMLIGPSGVGKEGLARTFHRHSGRPGAFVPRNCAMFTKDLVRAELFGANAGSYTGATHKIVGAVERANGGTLFLDELGEMPLEVQPTLLRFLDRGEFERLGEYGNVRVADVRMVAATNRDLRRALERNEFRADLWYRISNDVVEIPPLSERYEDVRAYLKSQTVAGSSETVFGLLSSDAEGVVREHYWHGNFRELQSFASRLSTTATSPIDADTCLELLTRGSLSPVAPGRRRQTIPASPSSQADWTKLAERAAVAFAADVGHQMPQDWDEVKEFVEKYLKPLLFVHLGHGTAVPVHKGDIDVNATARRLNADRGTAARQIERYLELLVR